MDSELLKYQIRKKNHTFDEVCKCLDISKSAFYRKLNGKSEFTVPEVKKISGYLHIETPLVFEIFFAS